MHFHVMTLFPPDPAKLLQFPVTIFKMCIDFAESILKLVV